MQTNACAGGCCVVYADWWVSFEPYYNDFFSSAYYSCFGDNRFDD
jgi:hypothetical protein